MGTTASRRRTVIIALGAVSLVLLSAFIAMNAFNNFLNPATTGQTVVFIGLSFIAFLLFRYSRTTAIGIATAGSASVLSSHTVEPSAC